MLCKEIDQFPPVNADDPGVSEANSIMLRPSRSVVVIQHIILNRTGQ